jgi:hypothetical protein
LVSLSSIEGAREHIIATEIESFLRKSHIEHFEQLERRLSMELRKGLDSWPTFVELTQRRNLFVHCDGVVSKQYMEVCSHHSVDVSRHTVGDRLHMHEEYFSTAFECLYELGVKLAHTIWRKLAPDQMEQSDIALNEVCFQLLDAERYELAHTLLVFGTDGQKKHSSALHRRMMVINRAIAVKFGEIQHHGDPLDSEDWSDCGLPFALAIAVLRDQFDEACEIMRRLGTEDQLVDRLAYDTWPLFREFRESEQFRATYKVLFGDEFRVPEITDDALDEPNADE